MLAILMECLDQQKGNFVETNNPSQHMPPRNRFHDLVDAAGVASRILWLFLGSGVVVVFLRTPRNVAWGASKKSDFELTDLFQRIILGLYQISWVYTSKKFITRMLCYWNSKNFWRKPPPTNGRGIHQTKLSTMKKLGESYGKNYWKPSTVQPQLL